VVESCKLLCVVAILETVGNCGGHIGVIIIRDTVIGCPTVVNNADMPEAMVWVVPPSEDDRVIVSYFASGGMEEYFTSGAAEDGNG
jgi:hypothetical protein